MSVGGGVAVGEGVKIGATVVIGIASILFWTSASTVASISDNG
jgi:hypothetical protein